MKRITGFFVLVIAAGCGTDVDTQVSGVFPSEAFIGRKVRVEISGDQTTWSSGTAVNFGDGITVDQVSVASPSAVFVDITIAPTAAAGLHDVTVTDGGDTLTLKQSFELLSPASVTVQGTLAQGSVAFLTINNLDVENRYDAATDADGNFINTTLAGPPGTTLQINSVSDFSISAALLIDVDATGGPVTITSGAETPLTSPGPDLAIAARTPTAITAGTPANATQAEAFGAQLFEFTPSAGPAEVLAVAKADDPNAGLQMIVLPESGKFSDGFQVFPVTFFGTVLREGLGIAAKTPQKMFLIPLDTSGAVGYSFTVTANSVTLTAAAEQGTAHATNATAQVVTKTAFVDSGNLTDENEVDVYKIAVVAGDIGKKVHVITFGGDPFTDTVVEVLGGAAGTTSLGGESSDADFGEDFTSTAIPAATTSVFVKITGSHAGFFDPADTTYVASIVFE